MFLKRDAWCDFGNRVIVGGALCYFRFSPYCVEGDVVRHCPEQYITFSITIQNVLSPFKMGSTSG